jgi:hypothetical protein
MSPHATSTGRLVTTVDARFFDCALQTLTHTLAFVHLLRVLVFGVSTLAR